MRFKVPLSAAPGSTLTVRARAFIKVRKGKSPKKSIRAGEAPEGTPPPGPLNARTPPAWNRGRPLRKGHPRTHRHYVAGVQLDVPAVSASTQADGRSCECRGRRGSRRRTAWPLLVAQGATTGTHSLTWEAHNQ